MKKFLFLFIAASGLVSHLSAQDKGQYNIKTSPEFENEDGMPLDQTNPYMDGRVLLTYAKGDDLDKIGFQLFDNMQMKTSSQVDVKALFANKRSYYDRVTVMNTKSYIMVREVFRETKTEGISAVELSPSTLQISGSPIKLFESSRGIAGGRYGYSVVKSNDKSKLFYSYHLINKERKDAINKEEYGFYMFDENMKQLWGGEVEMPYTEARMNVLDYEVSDDGKLYYLISVNGGDGQDSHFELLVYENAKNKPGVVEIKIDENIPRNVYIYEDKKNNLVVAGFYSKKGNPSIDGAFMVKLDPSTKKISKVGGGYYEIPSEIIKSFMTDKQKEKLEKKEKKNEGDERKDLGINDLLIRDFHFLDDGSVVIVSEVYYVVTHTYYNGKTTTTTYTTYAKDIIVFNIDPAGKLAWIRKIPKSQRAGNAAGPGLSLSSMVKGKHVYIFYLDHIENFTLKEDEAPRVHQDGRGGYVAAVDIDEKGVVKKTNLGEAEQYETNLYMRNFIDGKKNNLITVERKRKKNMLFSIEIK